MVRKTTTKLKRILGKYYKGYKKELSDQKCKHFYLMHDT